MSLTKWHHLRPRDHQRDSSISTATPAFCLLRLVPAGADRRPLRPPAPAGDTGPISDEAELYAAWAAAVGDGSAARGAFDEVVGRHRQPHRRYHGVRHVTWVVRHVLQLAGEVEGGVADLGAVIAAAFYHDAVYDPQASGNEAASAALAERLLGELGWPADRLTAVGEMILATATHRAPAGTDAAVLIDADLAVLGSEPAAYQAYVAGVRAEYAHVDAESWRVGRGAVLRDLLGRRPLYATPPARRQWEARAAANMTAELATLESLTTPAPHPPEC